VAGELLLAVGLGLFAFVEPCSIGIHLLLIGHLERLPTPQRLGALAQLALTRATVLGLVGFAAAFIGGELFLAQRWLWIAFGLLYIGLGMLYLSGRQGALMRALTPDKGRLETRSRSLGLGTAFGLYVPACAIPLLVVLVGASTAQSAGGAPPIQGFVTLFVFGLALSAPLFGLVGTARGDRWLDRLVMLAGRLPRPTGALLALLGFVSIGLALGSDLPDAAKP
jgi:cytochrome c-type biogenesis protein